MEKSKTKKPSRNLLAEQERLEKSIFSKKYDLLKCVNNLSFNDLVDKKKIILQVKNSFDEFQKFPAWLDEDDNQIKINQYGSKTSKKFSTEFQHPMINPSWITEKCKNDMNLEPDNDFEDVEEIMKSCSVINKKSSLSKGMIKIEKMEDLNKETRIEGPLINAVEFHPSSTVALVAGISGIASILQVDGTQNSKLQTIKFHNFCIDCAHFTNDGEQFIVGCKNARCFYYYDMIEGRSVQVSLHHNIGPINMANFRVSPDGRFIVICGKYGNIHLLTAKTKEWAGDLKMNSNVVDLTFNSDGTRMYSYSDDGEIYEWDMTNRYCVRKICDKGCWQGTNISLSSNNQILSTGLSSGIVNIYEMPLNSEHIKPIKVLNNLVTSVSSLIFNKFSEILAIASKEKTNAVRLVHFPSMTVFSNFPAFQSQIERPRVFDFSPSSGYFAIGNNQHSVYLYRLKPYKNY